MAAVQKKAYYDASKVRREARGRWLEILTYMVGDRLESALSKRPGKRVTCPVHGTSNKNGIGDGFRFFKDVVDTGGGLCNTCGTYHDGFDLIHWLTGQEFRETLNQIAEYLRVEPETPGDPNQEKVVPISRLTPVRIAEIKALQEKAKAGLQADSQKANENIQRVWRESVSLIDGLPNPLFCYFKYRGVLLRKEQMVTGDHIRYHSELPYYDEDEEGNLEMIGKYPAIIAAIRDLNGDIITLHRTYLEPSGCKAEVRSARKMMAIPANKKVTGAAIQLGGFPADGVLGVSEGLETAMSIMKVYQIPTWSLVNTTLLENFIPPEGLKTLLIWADKDKKQGGQSAAQALHEALQPTGIDVHILLPQRPVIGKSVDWNDILVKEGVFGFPAHNYMSRITQGTLSA
jgi:phage/plasmid primase-like uncharacterized protein